MSNRTRGADAPYPGSDFHLLGQRKEITGEEEEEVSEVGDNLISNKKWWRVTFFLPKRDKMILLPPFKEHCPWIWRLPSRSPCHPSSFSGHEFSRTRKRYPFNYHPHGGPYKYFQRKTEASKVVNTQKSGDFLNQTVGCDLCLCTVEKPLRNTISCDNNTHYEFPVIF